MAFQNIIKKINVWYTYLLSHPKLCISILIILALIPRLFRLTTSPQIMLDESANFSDILKMLLTNHINPAFPQWDKSQALLDHYPTFLLFKLGIIDQFFALRLTSVLWSILGILAFFFIIKKYTNRTIAFSVSFLFSYSYFYLQFSRIGWSSIHAVALGITALLVAIIASERKSKFHMIIAAFLSAFTFYSYRGGEIYIASIILFLIIQWMRAKYSKIHLKLFMVFVIVFLMVSLPWIIYIKANWNDFTSRQNVVSITRVTLPYLENKSLNQVFFYQLKTTVTSWILMLPVSGNAGHRENPQYLPLWYPPINPFLIPLYWGGLILAFKQWKRFYIFLLIFFEGLFLGQVLTVYPPNGSRGLIILPMIYFFIGLSIFWLFQKYKNESYTQLSILSFCLLIALSDFLFYVYWMSWINV